MVHTVELKYLTRKKESSDITDTNILHGMTDATMPN